MLSAADVYAQRFEQGRIVCAETADTFTYGMACRMPALEIIRNGAAHIVRGIDAQIRQAIVALHQDTHNLADRACASVQAAAMQDERANALEVRRWYFRRPLGAPRSFIMCDQQRRSTPASVDTVRR